MAAALRPDDERKSCLSLPVVIAGAGPCGLMAARVLQEHLVPFIIVERAEREHLCSNVGAAYELAPTALSLLRRFGMTFEGNTNLFTGVYMARMSGSMGGGTVESGAPQVRAERVEAVRANRAELQALLLGSLCLEGDGEGNDLDEAAGTLRCGVSVRGYAQVKAGGGDTRVEVKLSDGSTVEGAALLGCDGTNSAVRRAMNGWAKGGRVDDRLRFAGMNAWSGSAPLAGNSALQVALAEQQPWKEGEGNTFVWLMGSNSKPGCFMGSVMAGAFTWVFFVLATAPPPGADELTRRGGAAPNPQLRKRELQELVCDRGDLVQFAVAATAAAEMTLVGLFDRCADQLPRSDRCVALLGDAAHPQMPFMGQGINMALADAYVAAMRLVKARPDDGGVSAALRAFDSASRRRSVEKVVRQARQHGEYSVSVSRFTSWAFSAFAAWAPSTWLLGGCLAADASNVAFLRDLHEELGIVIDQSAD